MLSVLVVVADAAVPALARPEAVVRTLNALVPAVIEGVVRDLVLALPGRDDRLRDIADHAGCAITEAAKPAAVIAAGLAAMRGDMVLVLRAGRAPEAGFVEEVSDLWERGPGGPRSAGLRAAPSGFWTRLLPSLSPVAGLIAPRGDLPTTAPHFEALIRAVRPRMMLNCRLRNVA